MRTIKLDPRQEIQTIKGTSYDQIFDEMQKIDQNDYDSEVVLDDEPTGWNYSGDCETSTFYSSEIWTFDIILDLSDFDDEGDQAEGASKIIKNLFDIDCNGELDRTILKVEGKKYNFLCSFMITAPYKN